MLNYITHPINYIVLKEYKTSALILNIPALFALYLLYLELSLMHSSKPLDVLSLSIILLTFVFVNSFCYKYRMYFNEIKYSIKASKFPTFPLLWRLEAQKTYVKHTVRYLTKELKSNTDPISKKILEVDLEDRISKLLDLSVLDDIFNRMQSSKYTLTLTSFSLRKSMLAQIYKFSTSKTDTILTNNYVTFIINELFNPLNITWDKNNGIQYNEDRLYYTFKCFLREQETFKTLQENSCNTINIQNVNITMVDPNEVIYAKKCYNLMQTESVKLKALIMGKKSLIELIGYTQSDMRKDFMLHVKDYHNKDIAKKMASAFIVKHTKNANGNKTIEQCKVEEINLECFNYRILKNHFVNLIKEKKINCKIEEFEAIFNQYFTNRY